MGTPEFSVISVTLCFGCQSPTNHAARNPRSSASICGSNHKRRRLIDSKNLPGAARDMWPASRTSELPQSAFDTALNDDGNRAVTGNLHG